MAESRITIDGVTHKLESPFLVIATQNPVDHEGTFPLPEAQLDRFLMKFSIGYPALDDELTILDNLQTGHPIETLKAVASASELVECQQLVRTVHVDPKIRKYILQLVHLTRHHEHLALGGSPRATLALFKTAQAMAAIRGRNFVTPDDVKVLAEPVLCHRLILKPESRLRKITTRQLVAKLLSEIAVPVIGKE